MRTSAIAARAKLTRAGRVADGLAAATTNTATPTTAVTQVSAIAANEEPTAMVAIAAATTLNTRIQPAAARIALTWPTPGIASANVGAPARSGSRIARTSAAVRVET